MVQAVATATRYPSAAHIAPDAPLSAEAAVLEAEIESVLDEQRLELLVLLKNAAKLIPDLALSSVHNTLVHVAPAGPHCATGSQVSWQDTEVAIMLLYELGEALKDETGSPHCGKFAQDVLLLMGADLAHAQHRLVASALLECYVRLRAIVLPAPWHALSLRYCRNRAMCPFLLSPSSATCQRAWVKAYPMPYGAQASRLLAAALCARRRAAP